MLISIITVKENDFEQFLPYSLLNWEIHLNFITTLKKIVIFIYSSQYSLQCREKLSKM